MPISSRFPDYIVDQGRGFGPAFFVLSFHTFVEIVIVGMGSPLISHIRPSLIQIERILSAVYVDVLHNGLSYPLLWVDIVFKGDIETLQPHQRPVLLVISGFCSVTT